MSHTSKWIASLLVVLGCNSMQGTVRSTFSLTYYCPRQAIVVTPRPDVKPHTVLVRRDSPPAEVASDPARLRLWRNLEQQNEAWSDADHDVFDASGCGHEERYACQVGYGAQEFLCQGASDLGTSSRATPNLESSSGSAPCPTATSSNQLRP